MSNASLSLKRKGLMLVLSSPSGAGKTSISRQLLEKDHKIQMSVSVTTREKREEEEEGVDYFFVSQERFAEMVANNELLECAEVFGNSYGTPEKHVKECLDAGKDVLFDIDWQGTEQLAERCRDDLVSIFILPPSMEELDRRLHNRAQDPEEVVKARMSKAGHEISHWLSYDYVLINDDLEKTTERVHSILLAERLKRERSIELTDFVKGLLEEAG